MYGLTVDVLTQLIGFVTALHYVASDDFSNNMNGVKTRKQTAEAARGVKGQLINQSNGSPRGSGPPKENISRNTENIFLFYPNMIGR